MAKYIVKRFIHGLISIVIVVAIVMVLIYSLLERSTIFAEDEVYRKLQNNARATYTYRKWEDYGYLDYVNYTDWLNNQVREGKMDADTQKEAMGLGRTAEDDDEVVAKYAKEFTDYYESRGYTVERLKAITSRRKAASGGQPELFAHKDNPLPMRLGKYFSSIVTIDTIHYVDEETDIGKRGLSFTTHDPAYGGKKFSPAIMGNGTKHKYLLYFDGQFPYLHQNLITITLGTSYSVNKDHDVLETMLQTQGSYVTKEVYFPTNHTEESADDLHTATYLAGSLEGSEMLQTRFTDDYTNVLTTKNGRSKVAFSFTMGILASLLAYGLGLPIGVFMARHKDGLVDKLGTFYIVFIMAVPSLAYIFLFKAIGGSMGLPTTFDVNNGTALMYVLPIVSLALPSAANLMKWVRRYMIDQMNSDYVKFARSGGLSENEIFVKHILKNAAIPIVHGIPGTILGALTGAIITERVYTVPGTGNLLTQAINFYDNGVIVGLCMFYGLLSVVSIILGDVLMSVVDPRISFTSETR